MEPFTAGAQAFTGLITGFGKLAEQQQNRKAAGGYEDRARQAYEQSLKDIESQRVLSREDLYKKLGFGTGEDDLRRLQVGDALKQQQQRPTAYNRLAGNTLVNRTAGENINALRKLRDTGFRDVDRAQLRGALNTQRRETQGIQDTLTRRAIERGADPSRAGLQQRLLAAQGAANRGAQSALAVASQGQQRRFGALGALDDSVAREYQRKAQLAQARDRVAAANTGIFNRAAQTNWQRRTGVSDRNVGLQNALVERNEQGRVRGNIGESESYNQRLQRLATARERQGERFQTTADQYRGAAGTAGTGAAAGFDSFTSGLGSLFGNGNEE